MSRQARSVARLAAVQALYQMEVSSIGVEHVIREFTEHRFDRALEGTDGEGVKLAAADEGFFAELVQQIGLPDIEERLIAKIEEELEAAVA